MLKEMLYNFINESFCRSLYLYDPLEMYDYKFNKYIGFDNCYSIQKDIKDNIYNNILNINIDNCYFIKTINIILESTINNDGSEFKDISTFISLDNHILNIKLISYNWESNKESFLYKTLRYSLYIAYYKYLKELNPDHQFVQFVEFLSYLDLYDPGLERYISLKEYVDSLITTENQKPIDENLFTELDNIRAKLESNKRHFNFYLD